MNKIFSVAAILLLSTIARAQTFVPANAYEFTYNVETASQSDEVSSHSYRNHGPTYWGDVDVYLTGRGLGFSEVTAIFTAPGDPTNILYQEAIPYADGGSYQVGAVYNSSIGAMQIYVAYEHYGFNLDIYDVTTSPTNPIVFNNTINLTTPGPGFFGHRIRMYSQRNKAAIVWDNPFVGLQTIGCEDGNWGAVKDLSGTLGEMDPDLAISDVSNTSPYVRVVYRNSGGNRIVTSTYDFADLMGPGTSVSYGQEDINYPSSPVNSKLVLDSKEVDDHKNWAYTYTDQNNLEVFVRIMNNQVSPGSAYTVIVNDGSQGNANIYGLFNVYSPTLHYGGGPSGTNDEISLGWYATNGSYNGYIASIIKPDGYGALNALDYLELPNATTPNPYPHNPTIYPYTFNSGIAFGKLNEDISTDYMYAAFYDFDASSNNEVLHHAFHKWTDPIFKKQFEINNNIVKPYPNPFQDMINTTVVSSENGVVSLQLTDIAGRTIFQKRYNTQKGNNVLTIDGLQDAVAGTYFLNTTVNGKKVNTQIVVKH